MLNHSSFWKNIKYIMLITVIVIGSVYALPNFYGDNPAVQITGVRGGSINEKTVKKIQDILHQCNISSKSILLENNIIIARFSNIDLQLNAYEAILKGLANNYIVAMNLVPSTPKWLKALYANPIKLGLDLRGGVHFLMEVDMDAVLHKLQEKKIDSLCSDLRNKNIIYKKIKKTSSSVIEIDMCDRKHRDMAINYLQPRHIDLVITSNSNSSLRAVMRDKHLNEIYESAMQQNINILRNRVNKLGIAEPLVQRQGFNQIVIELPGIQDIAHAKEIIGATATLEFRLVNTDILLKDTNNIHIPNDSEMKHMNTGETVAVYKHIILTGDHITDSTASRDEYNRPQVNISLDNAGGKIISDFTKDNIGKLMATLFVEYKNTGKKDEKGHSILEKQEEIINIANIQSRLNNYFCITGIKTHKEAHQLSLLLRAGALIAPIHIVEERIIGPSMGQQNIQQGFQACLWSLVFCIIFILLFYKKFGLIAINALFCNLILIIGIMSILPGVTLTMPGIAGIVLTLTVAVDANVLINERIKEELRSGCSIQWAIHQGYKGALSSIVDANLTTLIKALILYIVGTSSVRGFAITTAIGIVTSMFTAIIGTHAIVDLLYRKKRINKLSI